MVKMTLIALFYVFRLRRNARKTVWHQTYAMDAWGTEASTAMARLVSKPVSFGIKAVLANQIPTGVTAAPDEPKLVDAWLSEIAQLAQHLEIVDHTA